MFLNASHVVFFMQECLLHLSLMFWHVFLFLKTETVVIKFLSPFGSTPLLIKVVILYIKACMDFQPFAETDGSFILLSFMFELSIVFFFPHLSFIELGADSSGKTQVEPGSCHTSRLHRAHPTQDTLTRRQTEADSKTRTDFYYPLCHRYYT